jgi:hypothetical protein
MEFTRVISPVEDMEIWSASSDGFSFVISYENRSGPGFTRTPRLRGVVASDRSEQERHQDRGLALQNALTEAEDACEAMLRYLTDKPE